MFNIGPDADKSKEPVLEIDRAREAHVQQIRKNAREDIITKRRNRNTNIDEIAYTAPKSEFSEQIEIFVHKMYEVNDLPNLAAQLKNKDPIAIHEGIIGIRKLLSQDDNPPIQQVIDMNLVPRMIEMVKQEQYPYLQMEAAWALTNVASGSSPQCQCVVDKGGIPIFIKLLSSPTEIIVEQAVWALGNIAGDNTFTRDTIIRLEGLNELIRVAETTHNHTIFKQSGWAIANLCRGTPRPKYESVKQSTPILARVLNDTSVTDTDIISDCCWALSYLSDGDKARIEKVVCTGVVDRLVQLLKDQHTSILLPALRTVGNIATGNEKQTETLIKANVMSYFMALLGHKKTLIRRQCAWAISNIAAGPQHHAMLIMNNPGLVEQLLKLLSEDHIDVKKQVCWAFSNLFNSAEPLTYCTFIKQYGLMKYFVGLLSNSDEDAIDAGLEGIRNCLTSGDKIKNSGDNPMIVELSSFNGIDKLEELQQHKSNKVYKKSYAILETFFMAEDPLN